MARISAGPPRTCARRVHRTCGRWSYRPAVSVLTVRLLAWRTPLLSHVEGGVPVADLCSILRALPVAARATLQALQAVSAWPSRVLSRGLSSEAQFQHPVAVHTSRGVSCPGKCGWCFKDHLCWSLSTLWGLRPAHALSSQASESLYLSRQTSQLLKEVSRVREPFFFHSSLPGAQVLSRFLFSLFPLSFSVTWGSFLPLGLYEVFCGRSVGVL